MKKSINKISVTLIFSILLSLTSCKIDTLSDVKSFAPVVNLVQVGNNAITSVTTDNVIIDKTNSLVRKTLGLSFSGFQSNTGFTADLNLDYNKFPSDCEKFNTGECYISNTANDSTRISGIAVPAGAQQKAFYINIKKSAITAHAGKKVGIMLRISKLSNYNIKTDSTYIVMDMNDFGTLSTDVTNIYFKNTTFQRMTGTTTRFASLQDWTTSAALNATRPPQGAGYDQNAGCLGVEKWSGGDPSIFNGKIFQTFTLPLGHYKVVLTMKQVRGIGSGELNCLVAADGMDLPNDVDIATAIKSQVITIADEAKDVPLEFTTTTDKKVSIGILLNINAGSQRVLQAKTIKMFKLTNLFD